ncbi:1-(5-phosphoribosyl)-5-[(5-phosphoribosylamino)methylideneamino] imidazole-4-carboxamide isomerase [Planktothrix agardhii]|jgi:phosphoribosylformimino-5-aminoimidazole carboxamide ribotide isomerase|uniref:1-(5-phosphoribosyl)-5-[(5- phosphoribosylamino)methylideneamino]imidazole-4- carboxamide isomerase n=1 Tax=Planktothrix agardhii TaxID=1160 RepID=UPI001A1D6F0E|nr:1-(5-phosphoribosyl)-5-[(5-phosphoribosylamino)methylideneamino]imidazole-4-carboxamide isomerase [Planktothrix agardhii]MBG0747720.1 1-(5-phosphoribosyl)-5-[(5-phosphoribosylamino)methylideneamino]imidazole-4-carboxamide isomerase [Planktothrix agardhii KL2]MCF3573916.1 1-(5-phosphoribosyl)-5-[(5-phosphoribosylamino)methylideneamino]imidazole-4-carboxamide isomerase [Planktothrix agardhii 1812]MCF3582168.1 1-(5-phosphoribosyl)-5-[(5-phosphoribosylamino)methylideneamino]imidazole-4-carboxamid
MNIIPAIDLLDGRCVRLYQGDYNQAQTFNEDPIAVAQDWVEQGATRLHLVDLDGAKTGQPINYHVIEAIANTINIPVQVGGGLRNREKVATLLNLGVERAILGTVAVENPKLIAELCAEFPGHIAVGIDARNGKVATKGWLETSEVLATDLAEQMAQLGVAAIIYTDIHRDGTLTGPNLEALREIANIVAIPVIASGGVSSITDLLSLLSLEPLGVTDVIVGRAIYTGDINLKEAIQSVGQGRWQDVPPDFGNSTFA